MAKKKSNNPAADGDAAILDSIDDFGSAEVDRDSSLLPELQEDEQEREGPKTPGPTDPEWSDFVLSQFTDSETDDDGNPFVHGLRRVGRKLLGILIESSSKVVQAPLYQARTEGSGLAGAVQPAVVEHTLVFVDDDGVKVAHTDVADAYFGNTDPEFARYASATAATRAEARAYRKALMLSRVVAAEEKTIVPIEESSCDGRINATQISFINILCQRNGINAMKFVNSGSKQYERVEDIPWEVAEKMAEHLSNLAKDKSKIPAEIKGYNPDWRKS